ncbi:xanthine dehydrogenase family protein molybdopterin-binding subunit [Pigmentiphaga litoralis]|uniref:Carbon-monoxide dehydrogenase large subunit n=1 Tax=Pigmentiphaga litoralis TaxID=516702 RepID=A0A7Y9IS78_9BURK|nr:xanthine dehydrogenase family protein molybdopterin-binding subunit [Pigmentiphaga litoralis]NYE24342.1 carbon-monoxide dehydrogenase large subunit [Pigmentiphaga litoralis]NYE82044.1 carbon-monoxide dehydrogenase large subunit [Pigmentiphaga litoralis]
MSDHAASAPATSLLGGSPTRPEARRFVSGQGRYLDDIDMAGVLQVAFLRSPFARATFQILDLEAARACPGVVAVMTGEDLHAVCAPWQTTFATLPTHHSAPQHPMAIGEAYWQGEAIVAVVAETRAQAEDALEQVVIDWTSIDATVDPHAALQDGALPCHPALQNNLALDRRIDIGDADTAFATAAHVVTQRFVFGRQTGVTLEPRGILAAFDARVGELTVYASHQAPFQMQEIFARQLALPLEQVRVVCPDVGGAFGIKLHAYADEVAVAAMAVLLGRPLTFQPDRLESFLSDVHARDARVEARLAVHEDGTIAALEVDALFSFGAYSIYPRSSLGEALQALDLCGCAYRLPAMRGRVRGAYLNKVPTGAYRAVGQPIASAVIEQLLDHAAAAVGIDPLEIRRRNHLAPVPDDGKPHLSATGMAVGPLSLDACLTRIEEQMGYARLRSEQAQRREQNVYRGIGLCTFVEMTGVGSRLYGPAGIRIAGKESVRLSLTPSGRITCRTSATDQGQGVRTGIAQVIASTLGVALDEVLVISGDTATDPLGGGAWASRGIALAGEAAGRAAAELRANILAIAAALIGVDAAGLSIAGDSIVDDTGQPVRSLRQVATAAHYDASAIAVHPLPPLTLEASFAPTDKPYFMANGVQAAHVEVDIDTGVIRVLDFWVVEDCGRVINPLLADEQVRGGVVQGIGAALYEHCVYDETGQMTNASLADYLVPMASEMPDIHVSHVSTPERATLLGAKGIGEAGTVGAVGAIWCAVNDALRPTGHQVWQQPFTPSHVLDVLYPDDADSGSLDR